MKLADLLKDVPVGEVRGDAGVDVSSVTPDSRLATKGALFVAIPGTAKDGTEFIAQAIEKGAVAVVTSRAIRRREGGAESGQSGDPALSRGMTQASMPEASMTQASTTVLVDDPRAALALIAANFYGRPAQQLSLVGVTGTSGKTTTARMIESIFDAGGEPVGLIGTIEYRAGDERLVADRTTPDAVVLQEWFAKMVAVGVKHAVMEVSSSGRTVCTLPRPCSRTSPASTSTSTRTSRTTSPRRRSSSIRSTARGRPRS
jgi:UDP-N-acetylmuramoyl-L-alanyl-D-glutamate--2,6-diaminopimelate ligase